MISQRSIPLFHSLKSNKKILFMVLLIDSLIVLYVLWFLFSENITKAAIGIEEDQNGKLRLVVCPTTPNCVCSMDSDPDHQVSSISLSDDEDPSAIWEKFLRTIEESKGFSSFKTKTSSSCHAVFKTTLLRFPDDFHAVFDREDNSIHLRSSSRVGISDLGVNKKRVVTISKAFESK